MDNKYIGKICPYCKTPFIEGDEIVVCNTCDMPHHKSCWVDNQGCTTFGCLGTIKAVDGSQTSVTTNEINYEEQNTMYCPHCGTQNNVADSFCKQCGSPLHNSNNAQNYNTSYNNNSYNNNSYSDNSYQYNNGGQSYSNYGGSQAADNEMAQFVAVKGEYYMPKFQQMRAMNIKTSWNWSAFLVTAYWFIYRKMYAYGAAILGVNFFINLIGAPFLSIVIWILAGLFGNYIYMQDIEKRVAKSKTVAEPYRNQYVIQHSGVSPAAVTLVIIGFIVVEAILVGMEI